MRIKTDSAIVFKVAGSSVGVNTSAYADGDLVGDKITLSTILPLRGGGGVLQSIVLHDLDSQAAALVLLIWDQNPASTTFTDNSALYVADADLVNIIARVKIAASDYAALADNSVGEVDSLSIPLRAATSDGTLYAAFVSDGATPTYSANGLSLTLNLLIDGV